MLDFTSSVIILCLSRSTLRGAPSGGVLKAGTGSGTCERWETQPRPRAVLGQPRRALATRPGPTTVKGLRSQDAALARRKARGAPQVHLIVRSNPDTPPGAIRAQRLVGAPTPSPEGEAKRHECGRPPGPEPQTGADFLLTQRNA